MSVGFPPVLLALAGLAGLLAILKSPDVNMMWTIPFVFTWLVGLSYMKKLYDREPAKPTPTQSPKSSVRSEFN